MSGPLRFPDDAVESLNKLVIGLQYDCAVGVLGAMVKINPPTKDALFDFAKMRAFPETAVGDALRDADTWFPRLAFLSMMGRVELHLGNLLFQRYFLETLHRLNVPTIRGETMFEVIESANRDRQHGLMTICNRLVTQPTPLLLKRMAWLESAERVRQCIQRRFGVITMDEVKPQNGTIRDTNDESRLLLKYALPIPPEANETEVKFPIGAQGAEWVEEKTKEWKIGEKITLTVEEMQGVSLAINFAAQQLYRGYLDELQPLVNEMQNKGHSQDFPGN